MSEETGAFGRGAAVLMDPALEEAMRDAAPSEPIAVIARVAADAHLPGGVRVITRFGDIVTLRVPPAVLPQLSASDDVLAVEAVRRLRSDEEQPLLAEREVGPREVPRRPRGVRATGAGTLVAVLDWGCDFAHPDFRNPDGSTRLQLLWDQRGREGPSSGQNPWGYGRVFTRADINRALRARDPYRALGYHPGDSDTRPSGGAWRGSHGTHVLSIAAGNGRAGGPSGVAPGADLAFVHLSRTGQLRTPGTLGDAASLLEALDAVFHAAGRRPCVVNMSVGAHGGPHDGTTLVEAGIDAAVSQVSGRAVVNSCGNYRQRRAHASGRIQAGRPLDLAFSIPSGDETDDSEIELYYPAADRHRASVLAPDGTRLATTRPGETTDLAIGGERVGRLYHRLRLATEARSDRLVNLFLDRDAPVGGWVLRLEPELVHDGRFHAWIEREALPAPVFTGPEVDERTTTGTLCNGQLSITVGALDPAAAALGLARFSSSGPTRDGRVKPELVAPGVAVRAARSAAPGAIGPSGGYVRKDGTSMAAPHVAGTVALIFEGAGRPLPVADVRALLFASLGRAAAPPGEIHSVGLGSLDIAAAEAAARRWARGAASSEAAAEGEDVVDALLAEAEDTAADEAFGDGGASETTDFPKPGAAGAPEPLLAEAAPQAKGRRPTRRARRRAQPEPEEQEVPGPLDPAPIAKDNDIVVVIALIQKPGDVGQFWADQPRRNRRDWSHPLSVLEQDYIRSMGAASVPGPLRMRAPVDPASPNGEERQAAVRLFGAGDEELRRYANYENRRRILAHYVLTHPATVRLQLGLYRLVRDINPLHFALERGWQIGSGREMFTGRPVSQIGAAFEFALALGVVWGVGRVLSSFRPPQSVTLSRRALEAPIYDLPAEGGGLRINGRWYTEHALERMAPDTAAVRAQIRTRVGQRLDRIGIDANHPARQAAMARALQKIDPRGVPPSVVEAELARPGSTNVRVVTARQKQVVVTVIPRASGR